MAVTEARRIDYFYCCSSLHSTSIVLQAIKSAELNDLFDVLERDDPALQVKNAFGSERLEDARVRRLASTE